MVGKELVIIQQLRNSPDSDSVAGFGWSWSVSPGRGEWMFWENNYSFRRCLMECHVCFEILQKVSPLPGLDGVGAYRRVRGKWMFWESNYSFRKVFDGVAGFGIGDPCLKPERRMWNNRMFEIIAFKLPLNRAVTSNTEATGNSQSSSICVGFN
ncbi:hypothetical protein CEXT_472051 [Caerostris extrusa]|uniref:Uncharacterized protein n=1 Tax=Caerostris extrusa TaxID=172846 RepID=A0AAV4T8U0_CAEEX|nr:hypothetical protein CEXT_472051 [Caerostris extrusa]